MLMPNTPAASAPMAGAEAFVTIVEAETMMAVPSDPATWRKVFCTDVPWFTRSFGSAFMPQVEMGMFTSDSENRRTV